MLVEGDEEIPGRDGARAMATTWTKRLRRARGLCESCAMPAAEGERLCDLCIEAADLLDEPAAPCDPTREQCRPLEIIEQERQWLAVDYERMRRAWPMPHGRGIY